MAKRTIRKRARKNKTIRKVMRGCDRRHSRAKVGGMQAHQYSGASPASNANIKTLTQHAAQANENAKNIPPPPPAHKVVSNQATIPAPANAPANARGMQGGARTRHHKRRLRYKKSMARKSRHA